MDKPLYTRPIFDSIIQRAREDRQFIQILAGPRQTGKTTLARQLLKQMGGGLYASGDDQAISSNWIEQQWESARRDTDLLVLDEIQKANDWPERVKRLWDEDCDAGCKLKVFLLGSAPLLIQQGLTESLAGRFELIPVVHWSYPEMRDAFAWDLESYLYFGGYPGAAGLKEDWPRWMRYVQDALVATTVSKDILQMTRIHKPALLERLFELGSYYSGQVLSFQKMQGQLQDAGNTTTLAHYLDLLSAAGLLTGIPKFTMGRVRTRASSPKLMLYNTALLTAMRRQPPEDYRPGQELRGRLVESAVGAHLLNAIRGSTLELFYWRERNLEVDFILRSGERLVAIEVKAGKAQAQHSGLQAFTKKHPACRELVVGGSGMKLEDFLSKHPRELF